MLAKLKMFSLKLPGSKLFEQQGKNSQSAEYDAVLGWIVIALLALGLVMVYSSSIATAEASRATAPPSRRRSALTGSGWPSARVPTT